MKRLDDSVCYDTISGRLWEKWYVSFTLLHLRLQCNSTMLRTQAWVDRSKIPFHHL